ncbi:MAG: hypothetical protein KGI54_13570 [Pseudomonadota bacterium]|nr:hypothetical protein [Pseudomonadota bacterium]
MDTNAIINDFQRRYVGAFIRIRQPGQKKFDVFEVEQIRRDADHNAILSLRNPRLGTLIVNLDGDHELNFERPLCGAFQHRGRAYIFEKSPQRQWQRGVSAANSSIRSLPLPAGGLSNNTMAEPFVASAFEHTVYTYPDAVNMLLKGKAYQSVALSGNFIISLGTTKENNTLVIWHWRTPIATVLRESPNKVHELLEPVYNQEVQDLVNTY